jgi:hypothetical protein
MKTTVMTHKSARVKFETEKMAPPNEPEVIEIEDSDEEFVVPSSSSSSSSSSSCSSSSSSSSSQHPQHPKNGRSSADNNSVKRKKQKPDDEKPNPKKHLPHSPFSADFMLARAISLGEQSPNCDEFSSLLPQVTNPAASCDYQLSRAISVSNKEMTDSQDLSYVQSLNEDRKKKAEHIKEQVESEENDDLVRALSVSAELAKVEDEQQKAQHRSFFCSLLPEEPPPSEEDVVSICFRLPEKATKYRLVRRFKRSDKTSTLLNFLRSREELGGLEWELLMTSKASMGHSNPDTDEQCLSLRDLNFGARELLWVKDTCQ